MHKIISLNETNFAYYEWAEVTEPKGVVQIAHGMVEHLGRYDDLAKYLNSKGFIVAGTDHRGHGYTQDSNDPKGHFGDAATWDTLVSDMNLVRQYVEDKYPELPYFFIGHSMGSMLLRNYLSEYGKDLAGAAIIGTGIWSEALGAIGIALAKMLNSRAPRETGNLLNKLSFLGFNKDFAKRTEFDWLSRDNDAVDAYMADAMCGYVPTNAFFHELITGVKRINTVPEIYTLPHQIPLFIASGSKDPVGGKKAVNKVAEKYTKAGQRQVETHVYEEARHEIFNEINRDEVFADLANWLIGCLD